MNKIDKFLLALAFVFKVVVLTTCWPLSALADSSLSGRWLDYYAEGDSYRIDKTAKVITQKPGERAGAYLKTGLWTWDMDNVSVSFRVKVSDWSKTKVATLIVGNGLKFENAATFDIKRRFVNPPNDEWIEVNVVPSAWTIDGTVDWKNIDSVLFAIADDGSERITAQIANIKYRPLAKQTGVVSITVDDGLSDTLVAAEIMKKYGMVGTAFIDPMYIDENYMKQPGLESISKAAGVFSQHLCRLFRQTLNCRPMEYITKRKIQAAKMLLAETQKTVDQIAEETGFCDSSYFCKIFKRFESITPSQFRSIEQAL
jgi:AraC-like DNA-binding protein